MEIYCVKCKAKTEVKNPVSVTMKNGKPAISGVCTVCGTKVFKIGAAKQSRCFLKALQLEKDASEELRLRVLSDAHTSQFHSKSSSLVLQRRPILRTTLFFVLL